MNIDQVVDMVKSKSEIIIDSGKQHQPLMLIITKDNDLIIAQLIGDFAPKFKVVMAEILRKSKAKAYVFIDESWTATLNKNSPTVKRLLSGEITVPDLPLDDRNEELVIVAIENNKSIRVWSAVIGYRRDNKRFLKDWNEAKVNDGRLVLRSW